MLTDREQRDLDLVDEIEITTGDSNRALWWTLVRRYEDEFIRLKLSELRQAVTSNCDIRTVRNRGAYFVRMVKRADKG